MAKDKSSLRMVIATREDIRTASQMGKEGMTGVMEVSTKDSSGMDIEMVEEFSMSKKAQFTKVICILS